MAVSESKPNRPGADAGWRVWFAFVRPWPRAAHAERSAAGAMWEGHELVP